MRRAGARAGVAERLDLRLGDLRGPPVAERVLLVTCPFRAYLHLASDAERLEALRAARELLLPGGRLVFDVFAPSPEDIAETHGLWLEREPGIFERADWDLEQQTLTLSVRGERGASTMTLSWLEPQRWQALLAEAASSSSVLRLVRPATVHRRRRHGVDRSPQVMLQIADNSMW